MSLMNYRNRRGQSVSEYAIVFAVVAAAVVGMQLYLKRGLQAKEKDISDYYTTATGDALGIGNIGQTHQYEPPYTAAGAYTTNTNNNQTEAMTAGGKLARTGINDTTTRTGNATQGVDLTADDNWR